MNAPRASTDAYINFLIATPFRYSCLEAGRVQSDVANQPPHDVLNRLLQRQEPDPETLWEESAPPGLPGSDAIVINCKRALSAPN